MDGVHLCLQFNPTPELALRVVRMAPDMVAGDWTNNAKGTAPGTDSMAAQQVAAQLSAGTVWTFELTAGDLHKAASAAAVRGCLATEGLAAASAVRYLGLES